MDMRSGERERRSGESTSMASSTRGRAKTGALAVMGFMLRGLGVMSRRGAATGGGAVAAGERGRRRAMLRFPKLMPAAKPRPRVLRGGYLDFVSLVGVRGGGGAGPSVSVETADMTLAMVGAFEEVEGRPLKGFIRAGAGPVKSVDTRDAERRSFFTSLRAPVSPLSLVLSLSPSKGAGPRLVPRWGDAASSTAVAGRRGGGGGGHTELGSSVGEGGLVDE
jgi:hypothetical protein